MTIFQTTFMKEIRGNFFTLLSVFLVIFVVLSATRLLDKLLSGEISPSSICPLVFLIIIVYFSPLCILSLFFSIFFARIRIARDQEFLIWEQAGLKYTQVYCAAYRISYPYLIVIAVLYLFLIPYAHRSLDAWQDSFLQDVNIAQLVPGVFRSFNHGKGLFYFDSGDAKKQEIHSVFIRLFSGQKWHNIFSDTAVLSESEGYPALILERGVLLSESDPKNHTATIIPVNFDKLFINLDQVRPHIHLELKHLTIQQLWEAGDYVSWYEIVTRFSYVLASIFSILLACILPTRVGSKYELGKRVGCAILVVTIYLYLISILQIMASRYSFSGSLIFFLWPHMVVFLCAIWPGIQLLLPKNIGMRVSKQ